MDGLADPAVPAGSQTMSELIDIVAASEHPGPLELYAAAARKTLRDLRRYPELGQAITLACMMSEKLAELVVRATREVPVDPARGLCRLLSAESSRAQQRHGWAPPQFNRAAVSDEDERRAPNAARRLLPEELLAAPHPPATPDMRRALAVDWQGTCRSLWAAGLRLLGVTIDASKASTDAFRPGEAREPEDALGLSGAFAHVAAGNPAELAHAVRREVFTRSAQAPRSPFTLALYAYQTMLLHRPEAYALASLTSPAVGALARQVAGIEGLLAWMRKHVREGSIFPEPDRVMLAGQVVEYGLGRSLDRALLIFAVLRHKGYGARVVQTTRAVYTLAGDSYGAVLIDAGWLATADRPEGVVVLAFDEVRQYGYREAWEAPEAPGMPVVPCGSQRAAARKLPRATVA